MFHHDQTAWLTDAAPGPREVIWQNLGCALQLTEISKLKKSVFTIMLVPVKCLVLRVMFPLDSSLPPQKQLW